METSRTPICLPPPEVVAEQVAALEDELKAMRRVLRASKAAAKANAARKRREAIQPQRAEGDHAA